MNSIVTHRLTKRFRPVRTYRDLALYRWRRPASTAVEDVSLAVEDGELFGLLGENGAGKTTLIRMLSTTLLPTSGTASVLGHDVVRTPHAVRGLIGLVSGDDRSFSWRLTGRQNLEFYAALYRVSPPAARSRIGELAEMLGITESLDGRFDTYSTGTRQRFAIARGLLTRPRVLFLDEPTRALDPIAADDLRRYIVEEVIGRLGCTVLLATHTLAEAEAICDRVAIIRHGRMVLTGSVDELRARTGASTVIELEVGGMDERARAAICSAPRMDDLTLAAEGERARLVARLEVGETVNRFLETVLSTGARIDSCVTRRPTLEDIYRWAHDGMTS